MSRSDQPGVYVAVELLRDLPTTMKSVLGSAMFVPPQLGMRAGHDFEAIIEAMGLGLITGLVPVGFEARDDKAGNERVADRLFRFTVDVSDIIPETIGEVRAWSKRV